MKIVKLHGQSIECYGDLSTECAFYFIFDNEENDDYYDVDVRSTWEATLEPMVIWANKEGIEILEVSASE